LFENALKLTYGNLEFKNFPREDPGPPAPRGGKGKAGRVEERWGGKGRGGRKRRGGREGLKGREGKGREGKEREEKEEGKGRGLGTPDVRDRSMPLAVCHQMLLIHQTLTRVSMTLFT
jgi:hypothetical protein